MALFDGDYSAFYFIFVSSSSSSSTGSLFSILFFDVLFLLPSRHYHIYRIIIRVFIFHFFLLFTGIFLLIFFPFHHLVFSLIFMIFRFFFCSCSIILVSVLVFGLVLCLHILLVHVLPVSDLLSFVLLHVLLFVLFLRFFC